MIKINNLYKSYISNGEKITIFNGLDFVIEKGDFVSIMGTSGSGKTTFLNLISGLDSFEEGSLEIDGINIKVLNNSDMTEFRGKNISFIFQQFNLIPNLTVGENIDLVLDINKIQRQFETQELLDLVGLSNKINEYPFNLSGGEQQRVAICRAFVGKTKLLLADEPTGNLDEKNSKIIMELIKQLHKSTGNTIIMITHDLNIAKSANKKYILENKIFKLYD